MGNLERVPVPCEGLAALGLALEDLVFRKRSLMIHSNSITNGPQPKGGTELRKILPIFSIYTFSIKNRSKTLLSHNVLFFRR